MPGWPRGQLARAAGASGQGDPGRCPGRHRCRAGGSQGAGQEGHHGTARGAFKAERERLYSAQAKSLDRGSVPAPADAALAGRPVPVTNQIVADAGSYTTKVWHDRAWVYLQCLERGQRIAIPLKGEHLPSGTLRILLRDNGQVEIHYAVDEELVCSTRPCGEATVGVDKGYTEAYTDSDGERHGEGLGDLLSAESDHRKVKGTRRNHLRDTEQKHRAKGNHRKANNIRKNNLGNQKWDRRRAAPQTGARPPLPGRPQRRGQGRHDRLRGPVREHEVRSVPPPGHQPPTERMGQGRDGGHPHLDISAQRFCAGIGQSGLHIANRLPHGPVAGPSSLGPVLLSRRGCAGRGRQCRLQHSGEAVRRGDNVVHALQGRACPARGTNQDSGGDCSTRTRVAGACKPVPINRERITSVGTEVCRLMEQIGVGQPLMRSGLH